MSYWDRSRSYKESDYVRLEKQFKRVITFDSTVRSRLNFYRIFDHFSYNNCRVVTRLVKSLDIKNIVTEPRFW